MLLSGPYKWLHSMLTKETLPTEIPWITSNSQHVFHVSLIHPTVLQRLDSALITSGIKEERETREDPNSKWHFSRQYPQDSLTQYNRQCQFQTQV
jgi:hypothetical protein